MLGIVTWKFCYLLVKIPRNIKIKLLWKTLWNCGKILKMFGCQYPEILQTPGNNIWRLKISGYHYPKILQPPGNNIWKCNNIRVGMLPGVWILLQKLDFFFYSLTETIQKKLWLIATCPDLWVQTLKSWGHLRTIFATSRYCYSEFANIFVNISEKTKIF